MSSSEEDNLLLAALSFVLMKASIKKHQRQKENVAGG